MGGSIKIPVSSGTTQENAKIRIPVPPKDRPLTWRPGGHEVLQDDDDYSAGPRAALQVSNTEGKSRYIDLQFLFDGKHTEIDYRTRTSYGPCGDSRSMAIKLPS